MAQERVIPVADVEISGVRRTLLGGRVVISAENYVATATLELVREDGVPDPGERVRVRAGFGAAVSPIFTGEIDTNGVELAPNTLQIQCSGYLARTRDPIGAPPDLVLTLSGDTSDQEPVYSYVVSTAGEIIGDVLGRYGIAAHDLQDSGDLWGELEPIPVTAYTTGESIIKALDEDELYRTFDSPDGTVRRIPWLRVPSASVARTWVEGTDLYAGRLEASRLGVRNRVIVTGLPQQGTTGVAFVPTGIAEGASEFVPTPPEFRALIHNSALLETGDRCQAWATAKYGEVNRLTSDLPVSLLLGDATLQPGMTVSVTSARLGVGAGDRFLVKQVEHSLGPDGFNTDAILLFASEGGGYNPNLAPIAIIDAKGHLEYLADGSAQYEFALDGRASYDPELGIDGIVDYAWTGTPTNPTPHGVGKTASVAYATSIPTGATVTLTVTDTLGRTGSLTIPLDASAAPVTVRDLIAALKTRLEVSRDGQKTWVEVTSGGSIAAVGTCEIAAAEYTFAWDDAGALFKVLANNSATEVTPAGASVTACWIGADVQGDPTSRVWAGCADGSVYLSPDEGVTWFARASAPNAQRVTHISESPFALGDVTMLAGNVAYHSFGDAVGWDVLYTHPHTALVAARFASGFEQGWIGFAGPAGSDSGASRLRERDDAVSLDIAGGPQLAITGLCFDVFEQVLYVADNEASDPTHGRLWTGDAAAGGNLVEQGYDEATWGPVRHIIRDGGMAGLVYLAAKNNLLKSVDGFATVQNMRTLTGGREGMMIGYGAEHAPIVLTASGDLLFLAALSTSLNTCHLIALTSLGFVDRGDVGMAGSHTAGTQYHRLIRTLDGSLLAWHWQRDGAGTYGVRRSTDDGATWANVTDLTDAVDIVQADSGTLYCYGNRAAGGGSTYNATILVSTDDGATWASVATYQFHTGTTAAYVRLGVDPANDQHLILRHIDGIARSTNGGATFGAVAGTGGMGGNGDASWPVATPRANRYAYAAGVGGGGGGTPITAGGTIDPLTNGTLSSDSPQQYPHWIAVSDTRSYFLSGAGSAIRSADGGSTWATDASLGSFSGIARDSATGDLYATLQAASGAGTGPSPYTGTIRRYNGGGGTPDDLSQDSFDDLGALWLPYPASVVK